MTETVVARRDRVRRGELTALDSVRDALRQIEAVDDQISAVAQVFPEASEAAAREVDSRLAKGESVGPLAGVPFTVKDNICLAVDGVRTSAGSRILESHESPYDATVTARLRAAGAIPVAHTRMDEFGMGSSTENCAFGVARNPWNLDHVPGGSSGGAAALCAATSGMIHLGSDTGGSIRQPASYCGVTGMKPSYGRVSRYGLLAFASSLDQIGPLAGSAIDCALALETISGRDPMDSTSRDLPVPQYASDLAADLKGLRLGVSPDLSPEGVESDVRERVEKAIAELRSAGAEVREVELPHMRYANQVYVLVSAAEASSNLARYDGVHCGHRTANFEDLATLYSRSRAEGFGEEVKRRVLVGTFVLSSGYYDAFYLKALKVRKLIRDDFQKAFESVDAIVCPTCPVTSFRLGDRIDDPLKLYAVDVLTVPANLASIPAASVPCGFDTAGLPVGLQVLAGATRDDVVLRVAHAYQSRTDHHLKAPGVSARA